MNPACELFDRHAGAMVDGELDPAAQLDFERHLEECEVCRDRLEFELVSRTFIQEALPPVEAPAGLREKILAGMDELDRQQGELAHATASQAGLGPARLEEFGREGRGAQLIRPQFPSWRRAAPLAAVAAATLVVAGVRLRNERDVAGEPTYQDGVEEASLLQPAHLVNDVVNLHSSELPADVRVEPKQGTTQREQYEQLVRWFRGKVEFPVRPASFDGHDARLIGARLSNVRDRRAAALYYEVDGRRLTVVVTDAPRARGTRVQIQGQPLELEEARGYAVPVREHAGLSYAFTGDVDREELLRLAATARVAY